MDEKDCRTCKFAPENCNWWYCIRVEEDVKCYGVEKTFYHPGVRGVPRIRNCTEWQPRQQKPYFADAKVGNEVYSLRHGAGKIDFYISNFNDRLKAVNSTGIRFYFSRDGRELFSDAEQTVFWSKPEIIAPPKPKRKRVFRMRKTIYLKQAYTSTGDEKIFTTTERDEPGEILDKILIEHAFEWEEWNGKIRSRRMG